MGSSNVTDAERFEEYLFEMDDVLDDFTGEAGALGYQLDYSIASLESLETILSQRFGSSDDEKLKNRAARYLGEVLRRTAGGRWELAVEDTRSLHFKLPVVRGHSRTGIEFCPIEVIENFAYSGTRGMLKRAVEAHLRHSDK